MKRKSVEEQKLELKYKLVKLIEDYETALYYETMPQYDPMYCYSYQHSNFTIPYEHQSVDAWIRAIIKHMNKRMPGHGGGTSNAYVVTFPTFTRSSDIDLWLEYTTKQLKKRARVKRQKDDK